LDSVSFQLSLHKVFLERVVVLFQVLLSLRETYHVDEAGGYPAIYAEFIGNFVFSVISLNFVASWSCVLESSYHNELLAKTLLPTAIAVPIALKAWCERQGHFPAMMRAASKLVSNKTLETFGYYVVTLSLVPMSTAIFRTFSCSRFQFEHNGEEFLTQRRLQAVLRIDCDSPLHQFYQFYALVMMCVYPIGVPLVDAVLMRVNRVAIVEFLRDCERKDREGEILMRLEPPDDLQLFKSWYMHYRPWYSWWSVYDILIRLFLTGFAVLFEPGSTIQIVFAIIFSFAYFVSQILCRPYRDSYHNEMAGFVNLMIVTTLFATLLIKIYHETGELYNYDATSNLDTVSSVLIVWTSVMILETMRYVKSAVEFGTSVILVEESSSGAEDGGVDCLKIDFSVVENPLLGEGSTLSQQDEAKRRLEVYIRRIQKLSCYH